MNSRCISYKDSAGPPLAGGARWSIAAAHVGGKAIFAGGTTYSRVFDAVDVYDIGTRSWSKGCLSNFSSSASSDVSIVAT